MIELIEKKPYNNIKKWRCDCGKEFETIFWPGRYIVCPKCGCMQVKNND